MVCNSDMMVCITRCESHNYWLITAGKQYIRKTCFSYHMVELCFVFSIGLLRQSCCSALERQHGQWLTPFAYSLHRQQQPTTNMNSFRYTERTAVQLVSGAGCLCRGINAYSNIGQMRGARSLRYAAHIILRARSRPMRVVRTVLLDSLTLGSTDAEAYCERASSTFVQCNYACGGNGTRRRRHRVSHRRRVHRPSATTTVETRRPADSNAARRLLALSVVVVDDDDAKRNERGSHAHKRRRRRRC